MQSINNHIMRTECPINMKQMATVQGCQSVPLKKPETDGKNLKKQVNLNQNNQKWAENR